jgi:hypothetical protein
MNTAEVAIGTRPRAHGELAWALALVRAHPVAVAAATAGVVARVAFWIVTDRRFEDALITVTHARNAAQGLGLTHHQGEPVTHGFTSALSVLVPLAGELVHGGGGFVALRLVSLAAFVVAIACAAGIGRRLDIPEWLMVFPLGYLALDQNQIFFGMSGMETQLATAVLLAGLYTLMAERVLVTGALLGLALLARPDFVLWVLPALVYLVARHRRQGLVAGAIAACVVLPWAVFTTAYYGSPVPQTIRAKGARFDRDFPALTDPVGWLEHTWDSVSGLKSLWLAWTPFMEESRVASAPVDLVLLAYVAVAFIALAVTGLFRTQGRPAWLVAVAYLVSFVVYWIYLLPGKYYEWYYGPFMALAAIAAAAGLAAVHRFVPRAAVGAGLVLTAAFAVHLPATLVLEGRIQHRIENGVREQVGRYLGAVVGPRERVVSEWAGYTGYYSNVTLYDYPGLTSPGAYAALERLGPGKNSLSHLIDATRPEWVVLRPFEWTELRERFPHAASSYMLEREFRIDRSEVDLRFAGVRYGTIDTDFLVFRRTSG